MHLAESAPVHRYVPRARLRRASFASLAVLAAGVVGAGCLDRPLEPSGPHTTKTIIEPLTQSAVDKIDLVLTIDNSGSMSDKQQILAAAVPDLVERLVNPRCVDDDGAKVAQPATVDEKCPAGSEREFEPIHDIHIGIISSSLGGRGSGACKTIDNQGKPDPHKNDQGHLLTRTDSGQQSAQYDKKGFLAWDHEKKLDPPGISDEKVLEDGLRDLVAGVGQDGCGYEAQLESWYRFLVDPHPVDDSASGGETPSTSTDSVILQQRRDFLRPDSLVAIIMLTDENDCSANPALAPHVFGSGQMWRARQECAVDPNDPCCKSCGDKNLGSCKPDPTCVDENQPDQIARLTTDEDDKNHNLRCFDQKRRFGFDALYPVQRYIDALRSPSVQVDGHAEPNPLFSDLDPSDENAQIRDSKLVFFAGIVGVPWQDIARNPKDLADRGFKNSVEMGKIDEATGLTTWDVILGDPTSYKPPSDPMMVESIAPRTSGKNPITGDVPQPPGSAKNANSINGHEWNVSNHGDLQYACVFDLPEPVVCTDPPCDCTVGTGQTADEKGNPLCQDETGAYTTTQYRAKAYPGTRELSVLRGLGEQGIVASVCPATMGNDGTRDDYGYRPAVGAIIDRLKVRFGGQCLPHPLTPDDSGQVSCLVIEASKTAPGGCSCDGVARDPVSPEHMPAIDAALESPTAELAQWNCFCEVPQLTGKPLDACQQQSQRAPTSDGKPVDGWCYVDPMGVPDSNEDLVKDCSPTERHMVRFVGEGKVAPGATLFITCTGE